MPDNFGPGVIRDARPGPEELDLEAVIAEADKIPPIGYLATALSRDEWSLAISRTKSAVMALVSEVRVLRMERAALRAVACVHEGHCACDVGTRHFWFEAFCAERDKAHAAHVPRDGPASP